jgi:hypothetical protein
MTLLEDLLMLILYIFDRQRYWYQHRATVVEGKECSYPLDITALRGRAFTSLGRICGFLAEDK